MVGRLVAFLYALMCLAFLGLSGCPLLPPNSPDNSSPTQPGASEEQSQMPVSESTGPSSLEGVRRGYNPITPSSSPLKDVYYEFDSYTLTAEAREILRANAEWIKANPSVRVEIEGHADDRGTNEYNLALGAQRAQIARDFVVALGVSEERLSTISYGEELVVCREPTEACWQRNRRVRFVIISAAPTL
jgi:peptidoglycan-associated lipoprotein